MVGIEKHYITCMIIERIDNLSLEFSDWCTGLYEANTESLFRLKMESRRDSELAKLKVLKIENIICAGVTK